jgi:hypothetical protein
MFDIMLEDMKEFWKWDYCARIFIKFWIADAMAGEMFVILPFPTLLPYFV